MKFDKSKLTWENYIQEVAEALVTLVIIKLFISYIHVKSNVNDIFTITFIIVTSLIIGFITMILEFISPALKDNVKQGIGFSAGVFMLNGFI